MMLIDEDGDDWIWQERGNKMCKEVIKGWEMPNYPPNQTPNQTKQNTKPNTRHQTPNQTKHQPAMMVVELLLTMMMINNVMTNSDNGNYDPFPPFLKIKVDFSQYKNILADSKAM